jgi:phosphoserine/homoserine phosphotransferase
MLQQADAGILFNPPASVVDEFPQFPVAKNYQDFKIAFEKARKNLESS